MNATPRGLGFVAAAAESARQTLLLLRYGWLPWIVLGGAAVLFAVAWLLGLRAPDRVDGRALFCVLTWWLHATVLLPWSTLHLGVQVVHGRLEDRTFQYLFLRPVPRTALLLGNWLAVAAAAAVIASLGVLALFAGVAVHSERWPDGVEWRLLCVFLEIAVIGAAAYAAVAVLFAAYFKRPLVWAAFFVVGLQMLTANLPVSAGLRQCTVTDPLRRLVLDGVEPDARLARDLWPAESEFRPELVGTPLRDLVVLTLVSLVLALVSYQRTEYDSRQRE